MHAGKQTPRAMQQDKENGPMSTVVVRRVYNNRIEYLHRYQHNGFFGRRLTHVVDELHGDPEHYIALEHLERDAIPAQMALARKSPIINANQHDPGSDLVNYLIPQRDRYLWLAVLMGGCEAMRDGLRELMRGEELRGFAIIGEWLESDKNKSVADLAFIARIAMLTSPQGDPAVGAWAADMAVAPRTDGGNGIRPPVWLNPPPAWNLTSRQVDDWRLLTNEHTYAFVLAMAHVATNHTDIRYAEFYAAIKSIVPHSP